MKKASGFEPLAPQRFPALDIEIDPGLYAGVYEDVAAEHTITERDGRLSVSSRAKVAFYDTTSTDPTPAFPLDPVGEHSFVVSLPEAIAATAPQTLLSFVNPQDDGRMRHVSTGGRLYLRRSG